MSATVLTNPNGVTTGAMSPLRRRLMWPWSFILPLLIVLSLTTVLPLVYTFLTSLGVTGEGSVGDMGYAELVRLPAFWNAMWVQAIFVVSSVSIELVLGVSLAFLLNSPGRFTTFLRGVILAPTLLPTIVVALVASFVLQSRVGLVSLLLKPFGIEQAWLSSGPSAIAVLVGVDVWQYAPFVAILVLAGLQGIPEETIEAAKTDGAPRGRIVRHIILPQLMPGIIAAGLLRFIDAIQVFPTIYVLTSGGPGISTTALNYFGFVEYFQLGHRQAGAAAAVILTAVTLLIAVTITVTLKGRKK